MVKYRSFFPGIGLILGRGCRMIFFNLSKFPFMVFYSFLPITILLRKPIINQSSNTRVYSQHWFDSRGAGAIVGWWLFFRMLKIHIPLYVFTLFCKILKSRDLVFSRSLSTRAFLPSIGLITGAGRDAGWFSKMHQNFYSDVFTVFN